MSHNLELVNLKRRDDALYLHNCGLYVRRTENISDKQCLVAPDQLHMAKNFLKGRRLAEQLRNVRRNAQKKIDRNEVFKSL